MSSHMCLEICSVKTFLYQILLFYSIHNSIAIKNVLSRMAMLILVHYHHSMPPIPNKNTKFNLCHYIAIFNCINFKLRSAHKSKPFRMKSFKNSAIIRCICTFSLLYKNAM